MTAETKTGRGSPPKKWAFLDTLKVGFYQEFRDASSYSALRTAASRAGVRLGRKFRVAKELIGAEEREVIRVYRTE